MTTTIEAATHVRWATRRDLPAMVAVEQANGRGTTEAELLGDLTQRDTIVMVAEAGDGQVVGFLAYRLESPAIVLTRFGILPGRFGRGPLVDRLFKKAESHRRRLAIPLENCATDTVRHLCRAAAPAAVLADALQDADCPEEWLLAALREPTAAAGRLAQAIAWDFERRELAELLAVQAAQAVPETDRLPWM